MREFNMVEGLSNTWQEKGLLIQGREKRAWVNTKVVQDLFNIDVNKEFT